MVKIKKSPARKQEATESPALHAFVQYATTCSLHELRPHLQNFPPRWPFPRGDLFHWIPVLNRFDAILELFIDEYQLQNGPQSIPFTNQLISKGDDVRQKLGESDLGSLASDADVSLVEEILRFSRYLIDNCSNRSLYASSARLDCLLNTTSLSLLLSTLQLALRLAQRFNALRGKIPGTPSQHANAVLLANHFAIDIDKLRKIAAPFSKVTNPETSSPSFNADSLPERPEPSQVGNSLSTHNLVAFSTSRDSLSSEGNASNTDTKDSIIRDFGSVTTFYWNDAKYEAGAERKDVNSVTSPNGSTSNGTQPATPRAESSSQSNLNPGSGRLFRADQPQSTPNTPSSTKAPQTANSSFLTVSISSSEFQHKSLGQLVAENSSGLSKIFQYDLLQRIRVAAALGDSTEQRQVIVAVRILAVAILSFVLPENTFNSEILTPDFEEPRTSQLIWQLAELVGPPQKTATVSVPRWLQAIAFNVLEAVGRFKTRATDVYSSLSVNANHGILIYVIRKAVADLKVEKSEEIETEEDEWREALFALLTWLPTGVRIGDALVTAGLLPIMAEALTLKTTKAERYFPKILQFLDTFVYNIREAFQELANARGLEIISDLTSYQVDSALRKAEMGEVTPPEQRTKIIDYQIPFVRQQTLRWLFKFLNHLMSHSGTNIERLLRNFIDSPPLLRGLKTVIENGPVFGATIWAGALSTVNAFINNEPTSYAVIAEAGLSKALLESITGSQIADDKGKQSSSQPLATGTSNNEPPPEAPSNIPTLGNIDNANPSNTLEVGQNGLSAIGSRNPGTKLAQGILPATDAIATIPGSYSAICLNSSGLALFQASHALESFFEIFESDDHMKCLASESELSQSLGASFDELVRHHPQLRADVLKAVLIMVVRVTTMLRLRASSGFVGSKLLYQTEQGEVAVCGSLQALHGEPEAVRDHANGVRHNSSSSDIEMIDATEDPAPVFLRDCNDIEDSTSGTSVSSVVDAVAKFLIGFFGNTNLIAPFIAAGGFGCLLDLATLPSLPCDFNTVSKSISLSIVLHMMIEQKPHLTMPSLSQSTLAALDDLSLLIDHEHDESFFRTVIERRVTDQSHVSDIEVDDFSVLKSKGTSIIKALVKVSTLLRALSDAFSAPNYHHRNYFNPLTHMNLTDYYTKIVTKTSQLYRRCLWEKTLMMHQIPAQWKDIAINRLSKLNKDGSRSVLSIFSELERTSTDSPAGTSLENESGDSSGQKTGDNVPSLSNSGEQSTLNADDLSQSAEFRNYLTLWSLFTDMQGSFAPLFQNIAKSLIIKRQEPYQRQNSNAIADAMAQGLLDCLKFGLKDSESLVTYRSDYLCSVLQTLLGCLIDDIGVSAHHGAWCMTLLLQYFRSKDGIAVLRDTLEMFTASELAVANETPASNSTLTPGTRCIKVILDLFDYLARSKVIVDSQQSMNMMSGHRDKERSDYFSANQLLVELRMTVLPAVNALWESNFLDSVSSSLAKSVIEILKTVLEGDGESGAAKRSDRAPSRSKPYIRPWRLSSESLTRLRQDENIDKDIAKEALFRCYNNHTHATEYCQALKSQDHFARNPIPAEELEHIRGVSKPRVSASDSIAGPSSQRSTIDSASNVPSNIEAESRQEPLDGSAPTLPHIADFMRPMALNNMGIFTDTHGMALTNSVDPAIANQDLLSMNSDQPPDLNEGDSRLTSQPRPSDATVTPIGTPGPSVTPIQSVVPTAVETITIDDLNEKRAEVRQKLIEQALNILNVHDDITFELSDLILASAGKAEDPSTMQQDIVSTLIQSLLSLQPDDENFKAAGKNIASYAHLLGLVVRNDSFASNCMEDLRDNFSALVGFVRRDQDVSTSEGSPWIAPVLLILEKMLSEDASPNQVRWIPPGPTEDPYNTKDAELQQTSNIAESEKLLLLEAIIDILHLLGKDEALAHSVTRILVMLTRSRRLATRLGERKNLQRLFKMVKGLAGVMTEKLQNAIMIVLRHIVEDEDVIRQIMRSEIKSFFESRSDDMEIRQTMRLPDTNTYLRMLSPVIIREPSLFVEITNELVKLTKYDKDHRHQSLALKQTDSPETSEKAADPTPKTSDLKTDASMESGTPVEEAKSSIASQAAAEKGKTPESKTPFVSNPDGVVHYLLCELLSYKEVEDSEPKPAVPSAVQIPEIPTPDSVSNNTMPASQSDQQPENKSAKPSFKADQHPIFIYRCFILRCLTELLSSYNRTKLEFINFSSKRNFSQITTPSKPRSSILTYLLHDLIPMGTLEHPDGITARKKHATSNWATQTILALCAKTGENTYDQSKPALQVTEEPDLVLVRRFVLEISLKAFKEAGSSYEPLHLKYSRMLGIADLFDRLLGEKSFSRPNGALVDMQFISQKQLAKLMFEKGFIAALTSSIADIDLNFPNAKRAVKYILRPIKLLTNVGLELSQFGEIPLPPGQVESDEFSSTSSVAGLADDREETPDLFRNSTLGMLDPGHEDPSSSESAEDDEMYDGDVYDEEIEYDDEMPEAEDEDDEDDSMSDEELAGVGPIEGLPGDIAMDLELVVDEGDDEDEDGEEDDSDESNSSDDSEDGSDDLNEETIARIEAGEHYGEPFSAGESEDNDWTDGDDGDEVEVEEELEIDMDAGDTPVDHAEAIGNLLSNLRENIVNDGRLHDDMADESENEYGDDAMDEDEDEDEEDEDMDDVMYGAAYDDEDQAGLPWEWDVPEFSPILASMRRAGVHGRHHHHHHSRHGPWSVIPTGHDPGLFMRSHRSRHTVPAPRAIDDGTHPLLRRNTNESPHSSRGSHDAAAMNPYTRGYNGNALLHRGPRGSDPHMHADSPMDLISSFIHAVGQGTSLGSEGIINRDALREQLHERSFGMFSSHHAGGMPSSRRQPDPGYSSRDDPNQAVNFLVSNTSNRWLQESAILFGNDASTKVHLILNAILRLLAPPAIVEERKRLAESARAAEEKKKQDEERLAKEKAEKEAKDKAEAEAKAEAAEKSAREAAEAAEAAAAAAAAEATSRSEMNDAESNDNNDEDADGVTNEAEAMEGVEPAGVEAPTSANATAEASAPVVEGSEPVYVSFHGQQIDITNLSIDPEYFDALPDDMREEVLFGQIAEARSTAANSGQASTDLDREFLDALPAEIRAELLEQEAVERRRRMRDEQSRQQRTSAGDSGAAGADMDTASFLASLDPGLRQSVLMEQNEEVLAQLPPAIAAEARALGSSESRLRQLVGSSASRFGLPNPWSLDNLPKRNAEKKTQRKATVQMLDKAGVATLLKLMFISLQGTSKTSLHSILQNVCQNRHNRSEVVSLLLSILQDGTADMSAVERSFNKLSLRALQPPLSKELSASDRSAGQSSFPPSDLSPLMVVQQCLAALSNLTETNPATMAQFFLTEHEASIVLKRGGRKGKAKENRANRYPINSLLSLLDRKLILESSPAMELLSRLLNSLTAAVYGFLRPKDKDKGKSKEEQPSIADASTQTQNNHANAQETSTTSPPNAQPDNSAEAEVVTTADPQPGPITSAETQNEASNSTKPQDDPDQKPEKEDKKHVFVPPYIPDHNLSLMVNILTARECNARTFQDALTTTMHLSPIPGAKRVFGSELARQARALGDVALEDLEDLINQVKAAKSDSDIQGIALAKFSPSSANQAKFLRVLTAIDYIFDSKRKDSNQVPDTSSLALESGDSSQDGNVNVVYEAATFGPLWAKLSEALITIRRHKNMLNVATLLLPLVEALMLVCKNTSMKEASSALQTKEFDLSSPPAEDRLESLFFTFTEEHRKVLNDLVRQNPKLMSGTFSLLVNNPKVLEFDNKRNYFTRRLHARHPESRHAQPPLQLSVRRDFVFLDSFKHLYFKTPVEMKYGKLNIRFHGEEGVDAGGVTREWFQVLARQMFDPNYALFEPVASDRTTFHPDRRSSVNDQHLMFFKFIGRVIGKALYENRVLDCHFSRAVYKRILGRTVSVKDMETLDLDYSKSLKWMLENDITDIITETFSIETDDFGEKKTIELIEDGANVPVTEENKQQYVQLVVEYRLTGSVEKQLEQFLIGFHDIVPAELISIFNEQELELLISGLPDIDVDDWKNHTEYHNYNASSPQILWFWRAVKSFDKEERAKLLQFVTGTSKVPLNGFKELEGMNGISRFNIHRDYGSKDRLPSSHTCFNQLDLPEYDNYEALRKHILLAITAGSDYFGFA